MTVRPSRALSSALLALTIVACGGADSPGDRAAAAALADARPPAGPLPGGVAPSAYRLELVVVPDRSHFEGTAEIDVHVERRLERLWLHGAGLEDVRVEVVGQDGAAVDARWAPSEEPGVAAVEPPRPLAPGFHTLRFRWRAPFDTQLKGLYAVEEGGAHYAFTQMEPTSARYVFPSFDEPRFKTPFTSTLIVKEGDVAASNAPIAAETPLGDGLRRVEFEPTPLLPTYLVAFAVGPLDVVEADAPIPASAVRDRPVRLRGLAARGKGAALAGSLRETPALLEALERYFDSPYPYAKLDIVAVPDFASGAMENAGLVTFREYLLLWGEDAPESQRRAFTYVMAHELAHQWFGNLVTMPWWDDIWLNEAFATWMGHRVVDEVRPEHGAGLSLLSRVQDAMGRDALESARSIRQPIETSHDIRNAFDPITYSKGGGVLRMAERWLGADVLRDGLRRYMAAHAWGTATADDLLAALDAAAGLDVSGPLRTFLEQSGVPTLDVAIDGATPLVVGAPTRYLPLGSRAGRDRAWRVPACFRLGFPDADRVTCEVVGPVDARVPLGSPLAPDWVMPNAGGAGYYRYRLEPGRTDALFARGWPRLDEAERLAAADALLAAYAAGGVDGAAVVRHLPTLAADPSRHVATAPLGLLRAAADRWARDDAEAESVRRWARALYRDRLARLGWDGAPGEDGETRLLRAELVGFLALDARDPAVRAAALERAAAWLLGPAGPDALRAPPGPFPDAIAPDLRPAALAVAVQEGGAPWFDALLGLFRRSSDAKLRAELLSALGHTEDADLAGRALALALDDGLRGNEVTIPLEAQLASPIRRAEAWAWLVTHLDELLPRMATTRAGRLPWLAAGFCSEVRAVEVEGVFGPRVQDLAGGPRNLAGAAEAIRLCAARREAQRSALLAAIAREG